MRHLSFGSLGLCALLLFGCGETVDPVRIATPTPTAPDRIAVSVASVVVREVSLPAYATEEGIAVASADGAISVQPDTLWADDPTRAVTLRLTNALADVTGRVVASDPWPFEEDPEVVVDVRIEEFIAEADGRFVAKGRYYVADQTLDGRNHAHSFRIIQAYDGALGFPAIASARASAVSMLAQDIARRGLR